VERGDPAGKEPSHRLYQPPAGGCAFFTIPVEPEGTYRVSLRDAGGKELWTGEGLTPFGDGYLTLTIPASLLEPGVFTFVSQEEGRSAGPASRFRFLVKPRPR